jgi:hypothetical protein
MNVMYYMYFSEERQRSNLASVNRPWLLVMTGAYCSPVEAARYCPDAKL